MSRSIFAVDVGSVRSGAFAWVRIGPEPGDLVGSRKIDELVDVLCSDIENGLSIALGFECPLFMPVPQSSENLNRGRRDEGNRSMFAPAGAAVTTIGVHQVAWVLRAIHTRGSRRPRYTFRHEDWAARQAGQQLLFLWEAFVSGKAHAPSDGPNAHLRDALTAANYFAEKEGSLTSATTAQVDGPALSLVHAAAIWAGWASDLERLREQTLVLRPQKQCRKRLRIYKGC